MFTQLCDKTIILYHFPLFFSLILTANITVTRTKIWKKTNLLEQIVAIELIQTIFGKCMK